MNINKTLFSIRRVMPSPWGERIWEVEPGEFYRSRFLYSGELEELHDKYNLKSVVSLLGEYPNAEWLEEEMKTCRRLGMGFYTCNAKDFKKLINVYKKCEPPILVHCLYGSDRSGIASFIYLRFLRGKPHEEAKRQLSVKYGHFGIFHQDYGELLERMENERENLKDMFREPCVGRFNASAV